jgi:adenylosuccinate lyase
MVEVEYFIALQQTGIKPLHTIKKEKLVPLRKIYEDFTTEDAIEVKETERITNHDVKAVEYFIKNRLPKYGLKPFKEFIHFGLTSQDINNTAIPYLYKVALQEAYYPAILSIVNKLGDQVKEWKQVPLLARTHGQPASPTKLGKEIRVFKERIEKQLAQLNAIPYSAKFGGATGNFNAHALAYPDIDWIAFANHFVNNTLGLSRSETTTQIDHYDNLAASFDSLRRINTILIDYCRDMWTYISMDYFKQKIKKGEIGSSAMPHKVNPIDFENAEGNLGIANALYTHMAQKLPISRLQRDLTDSTVTRNIGMPIAHSLIALKSIRAGMDKLILNEEKIKADLNNNWSVVAEAIQTVLRREGYENPYEELLRLTRTNVAITEQSIKEFIDTLAVSDDVKNELKAITPENYTGIS